MRADYHTHTPLCKHAVGTPEQYVAAAIANGLDEYGISDHAPCRPEPFDDWRMLEAELPSYLEWIEKAKAAAGREIKIRCGLECDWLKGCQPHIEKLAGFHPWDYLIGAVHYLDGWDFDNPKWIGKWKTTNVEEIWKLYWETYTEMAKSRLFDIMAHPDLIKKFAYYPAGDIKRFYEPAIQAIADTGATIELNTAGWHKTCAAPYPADDFLKLALSAGIGLVISSDAHAPDEVARDFTAAQTLARALGFKETRLFRGRKSSPTPL